MNREGSEAEEDLEEEAKVEAGYISTRDHIQVHTSEKSSSLLQA